MLTVRPALRSARANLARRKIWRVSSIRAIRATKILCLPILVNVAMALSFRRAPIRRLLMKNSSQGQHLGNIQSFELFKKFLRSSNLDA